MAITFSHRFLFGKLNSGHKVFLKANTEKEKTALAKFKNALIVLVLAH
jgi:hypothetical protein